MLELCWLHIFILCENEKFQIWFEPLNYEVREDWRVCGDIQRMLTSENISSCTGLEKDVEAEDPYKS